MSERTIDQLRSMQCAPLSVKVLLTKQRIRDWVREYGEDGVYVSFSGGKDSTVLLHIVREEYPGIPAVFEDTGLEYPKIREFVKTFDNVTWLKPKKNFRQVVEEYGYPFIGKEVSDTIFWARNGKHGGKYTNTRLQRLNGTYKDPAGNISRYCCTKWAFMLNAPFDVNSKCCDVMKKQPSKKYERETGRKPILAMMAEESRKRTQGWIKTGCNAFNSKRKQSNPMAFWTEQDVLHYIVKNNIKIAPVYGDIVYTDADGMEYAPGMFAEDMPLKTTGEQRTGCMFCGYGCHLEKGEGRFERMKRTHPKQYNYIMKPWEDGGLGYKAVIDWINENGGTNIRY